MTSTPQTTDLLAQAVTAGLVAVREVADRVVGCATSANGSTSTLLLRGQPIAYVRHRPLPHGEDAVSREERCLRLLADTGLVPEVLPGTGDAVWTSAVRGRRLNAVTGTMAELADVCQTWGAAIAALHLTRIAPADEPPIAPRPWVLDPDRLPRTMRQAPAGSARAFVLRTLGSDRGLQRTVDRAADRWSADHWIHGDLTAERVLVQHAPELRVRFVDLRGAGLGDPGWDLAGALETIGALTAAQAPWHAASGACLSDYLLHGYRRAGGSAVIDPGTRALRMIARAWESAAMLDARSGHPATLHPAAGHPSAATRLTERLSAARELAARSARPGLVAA
jgi:Ser/Thr protein kinase RdoA (MazF antagonist)